MKFLTCPMCCNMGFTSVADLKAHLLTAATSMTCPSCKKSFKNVLFLIRHLDHCSASNDVSKSSKDEYSEFSTTDIKVDVDIDKEEDDIEAYFCTVCDIKIPDVNKHIQQFHSGQEVILQDDDDDEDEDDDDVDNDNDNDEEEAENSSSSNAQYFCPPMADDKRYKRNLDESCDDGQDGNNCKVKTELEKPAQSREIFYCPKCDVSFQSLTDHTSKYHKGIQVLVQDVSLHELFPASRQSTGSFAYFCTCCQKSIVRKKTLAKHLKLTQYTDDTSNSDKLQVKKRSKMSLQNFVESSYGMKNHQMDGAAGSNNLGDVRQDSYDFDDISHSIFNT